MLIRDRRELIRAAGALALVSGLAPQRVLAAPGGAYPFALGVAAGDPYALRYLPGTLVQPDRLTVHLTDRREDVPALVDHFVRRHARRLGKVIDGVSADSMRRLEAYSWPGNIRELRAVLERAVLLCRSTMLEVDEEQLNEAVAVGSYRLVSRRSCSNRTFSRRSSCTTRPS